MMQLPVFLVLLVAGGARGLIEQQPTFTLQPFDVGPLFSGARGILQCTASGTAPISYKWLKDGQPIERPGTSSGGGVYLIGQADRFGDAGGYQCVAENRLGAVLSNQAQLTVAYMDQLRAAYATEIRVGNDMFIASFEKHLKYASVFKCFIFPNDIMQQTSSRLS
jgi:hypothetical protein